MDKPAPPFSVSVRELPCKRDFTLEPAFVASAISDMPQRTALDDPSQPAGTAKASLELYAEHKNVLVKGTLKGWVEVACSRCVNPVRIPVDDELQVAYMPAHDVPDQDSEDEPVAAEDADVYPYDGKDVNLEPFFREQMILAVPYAPLCTEDCKGLCPSCGTDKNRQSCKCQPAGDLRLAGLKAFKV